MQKMMPSNNKKIHYLDGIRGVAALLVFFHHFLLAFYPSYYDWDPKNVHLQNWELVYGKSVFSFLSNGNFCVEVFFVLSGYVLSRKYFVENRFEILVSGAQRRFLRLYIPVAATILIAFILLMSGVFYNVPVSKITHSEWWFGTLWTISDPLTQLWKSLSFTTMFDGESNFDTSLWSIAFEFYGSLFVFAFLALTHTTKNRLSALILVFVFARIFNNSMLTAFTLGLSLNYVERLKQQSSKKSAGTVALFLLLISLIMGSFSTTGTIAGTVFEYLPEQLIFDYNLYHLIGAYFLVAAFVISPVLQRLISSRFFRFLGYVSFSFYLLHPLVLGSFSSWLFLNIYQSVGYHPSTLIVFLLTIPLCWFVSWLMAKYIDGPGTDFAKYVYNRWCKGKTDENAKPSESV